LCVSPSRSAWFDKGGALRGTARCWCEISLCFMAMTQEISAGWRCLDETGPDKLGFDPSIIGFRAASAFC